MASELKPCPFCGKTPEVVEMEHAPYGPGSQWFVICECSGTGPNSDERDEAIANWQRRALDPRIKALVEAAKPVALRDWTSGGGHEKMLINLLRAVKAVEQMEGES